MLRRPHSPASLHDDLVEAAETERRLPAAHPRKATTYWPEISHDWLAYADADAVPRLEPATARQVDRYDELLVAIIALPEEQDRRILWETANAAAFRSQVPWLKIGQRNQIDRRTAKRRYELALLALYTSLPN